MRKKSKKQWLWEFSKRIVVTVSIIFVVTVIYSCIVIWNNPDSSAIPVILENISDVFKVTVVSYAVKAGFENVIKIKNNTNEMEE